MLLKPKSFEMHNPEWSSNKLVCIIVVDIDEQYFDFIETLPYVFTTTRLFGRTIHVWVDTLYDVDDAWLDLYEQLGIETSKVELDPMWGLDEDMQL